MKTINQKRNYNWKGIIGRILFITFILCIIYLIFKVIVSLTGTMGIGIEYMKNEYVLALVLSILGAIIMILPSIITKKRFISIPNYMYLFFFMFLYCAIYLGEVKRLYYIIPHWDTAVHVFGGAMLGIIGFMIVNILNKTEHVNIRLSPMLVALFAFFFAISLGVAWEIYEYIFDGLLSMNLQKYALKDGTLLVGHMAISDTMEDLMVNVLSAFITAVMGFFIIRRQARNGTDGKSA
ncbi:MAG: hypothetical protein A2Y24_06160 [Clostridiales bacterium GWE2_32_10]|nr:MAG: hypothetical protein A2Y24_06160 [Clostridiales bacterium GWE2_32_10]HBY21535.1 hypothetical protein [Clostridiales bacterium]